MLKKLQCINLTTTDPEGLVKFYTDTLGVPVVGDLDPNYDGVNLGWDSESAAICIWDERKWGKASNGVTLVFDCDDLEATYQMLRRRGVELDPPKRAVWGGMELTCKDPGGNTILML